MEKDILSFDPPIPWVSFPGYVILRIERRLAGYRYGVWYRTRTDREDAEYEIEYVLGEGDQITFDVIKTLFEEGYPISEDAQAKPIYLYIEEPNYEEYIQEALF